MKYIQEVGQRRRSSEVSGAPGVASCDKKNANSGYSGFVGEGGLLRQRKCEISSAMVERGG